jgi:hypothetical protein
VTGFGLTSNLMRSLFSPTKTMHSPAPNIPGSISPFTASPFTEYMKEPETSSNDICELDEKFDVEFAREDSSIHALGVGGAASAGTAAPPQGGDLAAARAMAALSPFFGIHMEDLRQTQIE